MIKITCVSCAWEYGRKPSDTYCNYHRRMTHIDTPVCKHFENYRNPKTPILIKFCNGVYNYTTRRGG